MGVKSFHELIIWQKGMELAKEVYLLTKKLPQKERFGIVSQIQRSAVSIPSNIAEGSKRGTSKDYGRFLRISMGSAAELETQLLLIRGIYGIDISDHINLLIEIQKMLEVIIRRLRI